MTERAVLAAALLLWGTWGCRREGQRSPEATVVAFVRAMEDSRSDPEARRAAYELLSRGAQEALTERAQRAAQVSGGIGFQPWEMIAPGRWRARVPLTGGSFTARVEGDRAMVTVRGREGGAADVPLVREQGQWRIELRIENPPVVTAPRPARPRPAGR